MTNKNKKWGYQDLQDKISWEGSVGEAIEYGIRPDDIEDEELSNLWYEASMQYAIWAHLEDQIYIYLDSKLKEVNS